ncbi:MAG: type II toxin-antitoxin system RelE/ParE family toxin [Pseudomonadales bacterium]
MAQVRWLRAAQHDLQRLYDFVFPHSPDAATRAINTLVDAAGSLSDFPEKGRPWDAEPGFRELPVEFGARGYMIRYRLVDDLVIIVRVFGAL